MRRIFGMLVLLTLVGVMFGARTSYRSEPLPQNTRPIKCSNRITCQEHKTQAYFDGKTKVSNDGGRSCTYGEYSHDFPKHTFWASCGCS